MKKITLLCALLLMSTMSYAKPGRHNLQINIGGGYQSANTAEELGFTIGGTTYGGAPEVAVGGGMFILELGYLLHSVRQNNIIHGLDIRGHFTMSFLKGDYATVLDQYSNKMYGGFAMSYTVGRQLKSGRLMFDVFGFGAEYGTTNLDLKLDGVTQLTDNVSDLRLQYILPGVQFIMNNGVTIGWRNKLETLAGDTKRYAGTWGFNTGVTIGFTFGGGKQPWENKAS